MAERLTEAQRAVLVRMGEAPNALRMDDECRPAWWVEGQAGAVRPNVARALLRRGLVRLTGHEGGWPGTDCFTTTPAGRAALAGHGGGETP